MLAAGSATYAQPTCMARCEEQLGVGNADCSFICKEPEKSKRKKKDDDSASASASASVPKNSPTAPKDTKSAPVSGQPTK